MLIGIDGLVLRGREAGSLRYFEQLLSILGSADDPNEYAVFVSRSSLPVASFPSKENISFSPANTSLLPAALQQQLYRAWHSCGKLDLLHSPLFVPPLAFDGKTVMTVLDLAFVLYPQTKKWTGQMWWRLLGRRGIQKANRIITLSGSTRDDLIKWGIDAKKINIVYPYVSKLFRPVTSSNDRRAKYHLPEKYILYVGTLERRKNLSNLVRAFSEARKMARLEHALVLVGQRGWLYQDLFQTIEELELGKAIILLDYVPNEDLPGLYSGADLFTYLSIYEGFGFPLIEAMACGIPVLASDVSTMPEIVGDAGLLVPPNDVNRIASEMAHLLNNQELAAMLSKRGLERAKEFSEERFAKGILAAYEDAVKETQ